MFCSKTKLLKNFSLIFNMNITLNNGGYNVLTLLFKPPEVILCQRSLSHAQFPGQECNSFTIHTQQMELMSQQKAH